MNKELQIELITIGNMNMGVAIYLIRSVIRCVATTDPFDLPPAFSREACVSQDRSETFSINNVNQ